MLRTLARSRIRVRRKSVVPMPRRVLAVRLKPTRAEIFAPKADTEP